MPDCQNFEIAIDRRLRGALPKEEESELDAHCATCESCRGYLRGAQSMQLQLHSLASGARGTVDWDRIERKIRERLRSRMHKLYGGVAAGVAAVVLSTWGFSPPGHELAMGLMISIVVGAIVFARGFFVVREIRSVSSLGRGDELLAAHRAMLEKHVRLVRRLRWVALAVVVWTVAFAVRSHEAREAITYAGLACIVLGTWVHTLVFVEPRMRRELAELEPEGPR